ncbi:MAG TPA: tetratricopeptide repeat protein [Opitutaceae bacterium]
MRTRRAGLFLAAAAVLASGCHKNRVVTAHDREEAANLVSDAEFAVTIKDFPRAEDSYRKAAGFTPDDGEIWIRLGIVRLDLHDISGARKAYKRAVSAFQDDFGKDHTRRVSAMRAAMVLVLLGRPDEARAYAAKCADQAPGDQDLRRFVDQKGVDRILADPEMKKITP